MGSWCAEKLWDCRRWKENGLEVSTSSDEAAKLFDAGLRQLVSWMDCQQLGGLMTTLQKMHEADPTSVIGRCLTLGLDALGSSRSIQLDNSFSNDVEQLVVDAGNFGTAREKLHAKAVKDYAHGNMSKAIDSWEQILKDHPTDLMAVKFAHDAYFFTGDPKGKLQSIENVIKKWDSELPCYSYLFGMEAFAFEENKDYEAGKASANKSLSLNRHDAWATHARAHCHEMLGEFEEGIQFMESTAGDWQPCWMIACHNFWHNALFYVEKGDYETALSIYDSEVAKRCKSGFMLDLVDGASFLQRLKMEDVDVGKERWRQLVPLVEPQLDAHVLAFNDSHLAMIYSNVDDADLEARHITSLRNFIGSDALSQQGNVEKVYGERICDAIADFNHERFSDCFSKLYPIRSEIIRIGGSNAQRDVFSQILIHAGLRSSVPEHVGMVQKAVAERRSLKPDSPLLDRLLKRFL